MIEKSADFLMFDEKDVEKVKNLWHELSKYLHFSYPSLEAFVEDPEFCFVEKLNKRLFKRSLVFYFHTLDFFYSVLAWRFVILRKEIRKMCEWWKNNFNKTLTLTEKYLKIVGE